MSYRSFILLIFALTSSAQQADLWNASKKTLPTQIDGNSPAFWRDGELRLFSSTGHPEMISTAANQFAPWASESVSLSEEQHQPLWVESVWQDEDGTLFGWYHHEPSGVCPNLTSPKIGAVLSFDGGKTLIDLGIVLESGDGSDCSAQNGFFAGGHGDFSVVPDREGKYFYFLFTNYGGVASEQGIVTARLAFEDRYQPAGAVKKYYRGEWTEPGIGGHMTPVFPAKRAWQRSDADSFWGPATHWNTHLKRFVVLLNRSCCEPGWPQEGIYVSYSDDLSRPESWKTPRKIMDDSQIGSKPGYYPQVLGIEDGETDSLAGQVVRLYIHGVSNWELVFHPEAEDTQTAKERVVQKSR